jgi:Sec-independent protein translocase protein TatA
VPGFAELVLILIVVLVIFGAGKAIQKMRSQATEEDEGPETNGKNS